MRMVAAAQASASRAQALADRAAAVLFYVALVSGAVTLVFWWLQGDRDLFDARLSLHRARSYAEKNSNRNWFYAG